MGLESGYIYYPSVYGASPRYSDMIPVIYSMMLKKISERGGKPRAPFIDNVFVAPALKREFGRFVKKKLGLDADIKESAFLKADIEGSFTRLMEKLEHSGLLKRGLKKRGYCPRCRRLAEDHETSYVKKRMVMHEIRINVTNSAEPVYFTVADPVDVLKIAVLGVRNLEKYEGKEAILPISGRMAGILRVEDLSRPEYFTRFRTIGGDVRDMPVKENEIRYLNLCIADPARLIADLKSYGAYVQSTEQESSVWQCSRCGSVLEPVLAEHYYVENDSVDGMPLRTGTVYLNTFSETAAEYGKAYRFADRFSAGRGAKKKGYCSPEILKYLYPFIYGRDIAYVVCNRDDADVLRERFRLFGSVLKAGLETGVWVELNRPRTDPPLANMVALEKYSTLNVLSDISSDRLKLYDKEINAYMRKWEPVFRGVEDIVSDFEVRTDFYFDKMMLTSYEKFILSQDETISRGDMSGYVSNLKSIMDTMNFWVYPYVKKMDPRDEPALFKNCLFMHKGILSYIAALLGKSAAGKFPVYREDYNFSDELESDAAVMDVINGITEGRRILGIAGGKPVNVALSCRNGVTEEKLTTNRKFIEGFLNLSEIKFITEKEIVKQSLRISSEDSDIYLPVFDKAGVKSRLSELDGELMRLDDAIGMKRRMLFDYDYITKADPHAVEGEKQKVSELLSQKDKLLLYKKRLQSLYGEEKDG